MNKLINPKEILKHCEFWGNNDKLMIMFENHPSTLGSWGAHDLQFIAIDQNNYFKFSVESRRHKGQIFIFLHANDTFEIYLVKKGKIESVLTEIAINEIISKIDEKIEKIDSYNPEIK